MSSFTHLDDKGNVRMVDVTDKQPTVRVAVAGGSVFMQPETFQLIRDQKVKKGNVLETARIAGIMAAKKTSELIPMCHPLQLTHVQVDFEPDEAHHRIGIKAAVRIIDQTGVEMEALTGLSVALLTIWDLTKPVNPALEITTQRLVYKSGGKHGEWIHPDGMPPEVEKILADWG